MKFPHIKESRNQGIKEFSGLRLWQIDEIESIEIYKRDPHLCLKLGAVHVESVEKRVLIKLLESAYKNMVAMQRAGFDAPICEVTSQFGSSNAKNLACGAGLMVCENMGGFATYTLMSTVLSTIFFGALGFGVYTAVSSLLSLVLNPAGWIAMGGTAVHAGASHNLKHYTNSAKYRIATSITLT